MPLRDDRFANMVAASVTLSAANTETFTEMPTGISLAQRLGLVIDEIRYYPNAGCFQELDVAGDILMMGITTSNNVTDLQDLSDQRIVDSLVYHVHQAGTAGGTAEEVRTVHEIPIIHTFNPPIIFAGPRLYFMLDSAGFAAAQTARVRIHFRYIDLKLEDYLEIAETFMQLAG